MSTSDRIAQLRREAREYREYRRDPHCSQNHRIYEAERREKQANQLERQITTQPPTQPSRQ